MIVCIYVYEDVFILRLIFMLTMIMYVWYTMLVNIALMIELMSTGMVGEDVSSYYILSMRMRTTWTVGGSIVRWLWKRMKLCDDEIQARVYQPNVEYNRIMYEISFYNSIVHVVADVNYLMYICFVVELSTCWFCELILWLNVFICNLEEE